MVISYLLAQLAPWTRDQQGFLLVLGTSNIDEGLRGYLTKYDCSAADINPIGGINKSDLKQFLSHFAEESGLQVLTEIAEAQPSAELRPADGKDVYDQLDEVEMGMTYSELDDFGRLRKIERDGPVSMFEHLLVKWQHKVNSESGENLSPREIGEKVKRFFKYYSINRHKMTVLTPSYHAEEYGTDDNRYDLR
jgi:NAD+ synthase (glutamine-hydrolysing)